MSEITVIGLGLMGSALARAIQLAGHNLTVWKRSPAKMQPFNDDGEERVRRIQPAHIGFCRLNGYFIAGQAD